ncbi:hypothetical protein P40081_04090 [Paenibacillus sp. FSL P4-0081]|uniref:hypothetical protein n=1 Tax=Paenibacillus sp. FSL P4-0081 TaxID=1536769 RepID=UPI0004F7B69A|nr:hypothetical protein [Paenibacillus sp. FSL P4-0081]AIQ27471.1 hypothetical protein P40081_04090 [Paenibacillus sp. FSL P4-0081]
MKNKMLLLLILLSVLFVSCDIKIVNEPQAEELYNPPSIQLEIAVVGDVPFDTIRNLSYIPKSLNDIIEDTNINYDGLIIAKDYLAEAAKQEYKDFFSNITYPVFFMGTENLLVSVFHDDRLTLESARINGFGAHVSGFVLLEGKFQQWGLYLPNNPTEQDMNRDMILRISNILEDFKILRSNMKTAT